jgi:endonuclease/exonuclease/phosphatase family metal-dependent hydrolase
VAATGEEQPDAAAYGIALLSRQPVTAWQIVRLGSPPVKVPMWFRGSRRPQFVGDEPRVAVVATVSGEEQPLTVVNTHLSFVRGWGGVQLRRLMRAVEGTESLVLVGDLNMGPAKARSISALRSLVTERTFPATGPREQLDHVLARGAVGDVVGAGALQLPLSDHRALFVDLA